jgi:hypothetical protein
MTKKIFHDHKNEEKRRKRTICVIHDNGVAYVGIATCSSEDQYVKKIGRMIAEQRANSIYEARNSEIKDLISTDYQFSVNNGSEIVRKVICDTFDIPSFMLEPGDKLWDDADIPF